MTKCVIIVTYEPEIRKLNKLLEAVETAGFIPVIADNSEKHPLKKEDVSENSRLISMQGNQGIAAAQNVGIMHALQMGAEKIAFFDQDSEAEPALLNLLETALEKLGECVVAPLALEKETGREYPAQRLKKNGYPQDVFVKEKRMPQRVDLVISSGMMTTAGVLQKVGNYDEDFFIDFVDIEWCLRCKRSGIAVFVIPKAILYHRIGNDSVSAGRMNILVHSPIRTYYKVRNAFLLLYKKAGIIFTIRQILPALLHNFLLIFSAEKKGAYLKYYILGILHGICGVRGKYPGGRKNA